MHGARIGFFQGDIRSLSDDLCTLKPTVFPVVPRLLNRMYDRVGQSPSLFSSQKSHVCSAKSREADFETIYKFRKCE